jgi:hypothetical protein
MKLQVCTFVRNKGGAVETGVAKVKIFNYCDVDFIIDESGNKIEEPWMYTLETWLIAGAIDTKIQ